MNPSANNVLRQLLYICQFYEFDQTEFHNNSPDDEAWDPIGYMYAPSQCVNKLIRKCVRDWVLTVHNPMLML